MTKTLFSNIIKLHRVVEKRFLYEVERRQRVIKRDTNEVEMKHLFKTRNKRNWAEDVG